MRAAIPLVVASLSLVAPAAGRAAESVRPPGQAGPLEHERLSDEARLTRWTTPIEASPVRAVPRTAGAPIGRLRTETEDGRPEVVVALRSARVDDAVWIRVRFAPGAPGRPDSGWVPREALDAFHVRRGRVVVDRTALRARFDDGGGRTRWRAPVGVGTVDTPTPAGRFFVREELRVPPSGTALYGPLAIGTSAYATVSDWPGGGVVGLHGTGRPDLVPGRPSHGCVRVRNTDIEALARLVGPGTPVVIR